MPRTICQGKQGSPTAYRLCALSHIRHLTNEPSYPLAAVGVGAAALYTISGIEGEQRGRYKRSPNSAGAPQGRPRRRRHGRQDRDLRCQSAAELRADLKRLRRDTDSGRTVSSPASSSISAPSQTADPSSSVVTSLPASSPSSGRSAAHSSSSSAIVEVAWRNKLNSSLLLLFFSSSFYLPVTVPTISSVVPPSKLPPKSPKSATGTSLWIVLSSPLMAAPSLSPLPPTVTTRFSSCRFWRRTASAHQGRRQQRHLQFLGRRQ